MDQNTLKNILLKMNQITVSEISKSLPDKSDTNLILATSIKKLNLWLNLNIETKNLNEETIKLLICNGGLFWKSFFKWLFIYKLLI